MSRPPVPKTVRNTRPAFHDQAAIDRLIGMVLALTGEVSVLRDRVTTLEALGQKSGWLAPDAVDGYVPSLPERQQRETAREQLLAHVTRPMRQEIEGLAASDYARDVEAIETGEA